MHTYTEALKTQLTLYLLDPHLPGDKEDGDVVEKTGHLFQQLQDPKHTITEVRDLDLFTLNGRSSCPRWRTGKVATKQLYCILCFKKLLDGFCD